MCPRLAQWSVGTTQGFIHTHPHILTRGCTPLPSSQSIPVVLKLCPRSPGVSQTLSQTICMVEMILIVILNLCDSHVTCMTVV